MNIGGAITGGTFVESTAFPSAYRGDFFFPDYVSGNIARADILPGGQIASVDIWASNIGIAIDLDIGPDGNLYMARYGGNILRAAFNASSQGLVVSRRFLRTSEGSVAAFNVRLAIAPVGSSPYSNVDLATSVIFTDDPVVAQVTPLRAVHISQLRTAVDAVRFLAGLSRDAWTDSALVPGATLVSKIHVEELRSRLSAALSALARPPLTLTDPTLTTATNVKVEHIQELRNAVR